jgi:hypothetical protein
VVFLLSAIVAAILNFFFNGMVSAERTQAEAMTAAVSAEQA